jgi:hypothetical protein
VGPFVSYKENEVFLYGSRCLSYILFLQPYFMNGNDKLECLFPSSPLKLTLIFLSMARPEPTRVGP